MADRLNAGAQDNIPTKTATEARQGATGHNVRYVLGFGLAAIVIAFAILWFMYFAR